MNISLALQNATRLEDVVEMINSGGTCEGMEGIEFNAWQLAGQYAWSAAKDAGHTDSASLFWQLEYLESAGAEFDQPSALAHAEALMTASDPARFTVILLYPDLLNNTGSETYTWVGTAANPDQAVKQARASAFQDLGFEIDADLRFPLIAVLEGEARFCEVDDHA